MAIAIEGYSVVGLKTRLAENFDGGLVALSQIVPNATELVDDDLWRCSFMASADATQFLNQLEDAGLNARSGPDSDLVVVSEFDLSVQPYCEWLQVAQWEKGVIAWREGTTPETIVAREGWSPESGSGLIFQGEEDLEFERLDGDVHVYRDKQTGKEVYVSRTQVDPEVLFQMASKTICSHCLGNVRQLTRDTEASVRKAIADLESLAQQFPDSWRVHWFVGKARQGLGELEQAYTSYWRAFELEQEEEAVPRELAGICLELGKADEAVRVGEKAAGLKPDNAETLGNLACGYLLAARIPEAQATIKAAIKLGGYDAINLHLERIINAVALGKCPQPRRMSDLSPQIGDQFRPQPTLKLKTAWARFLAWIRSE